jgi:hypothetical protein
MLISLGHGGRLYFVGQERKAAPAVAASDEAPEPGLLPVEQAVPGYAEATAGFVETAPASTERFGYLFDTAAGFPSQDKAAALDALAAAMAEGAGGQDGTIPAIITYFGQFIDHDITANTNTEHVDAGLAIGAARIVPQDRAVVADKLRNMRKGSLQLDSLYGDGPIDTPENRKAMAAMRDGDLMRVGATIPTDTRPDLPGPEAGEVRADLPRLGDLVGAGRPYASTADLPNELKPQGGDTRRWKRKAFIGDSRNDENLIVAQLHVGFLRFHNAVLRALGGGATFDKARQLVTWHYQWIVVNEYLPAICEAETLRRVVTGGAPLYKSFADRISTGSPQSLPLPFEFSAAAFRFGHSMVRARYDYNANFRRATLKQLFDFTGNHPTSPIGGAGEERLPDNWIIDWARFTRSGTPGRNARRIDTHIAPPLFAMANEGNAANGLFQRLAARNLRRGHLLNLPSAQGLIAALNAAGFGPIPELSRNVLERGHAGNAVRSGGFGSATPLWFYVLKEAEEAGGGKLGPLGSRIVAETLVGLIVRDPNSYLNAPGGWDPDRSVKPGGIRVDSLLALLRVAGVAA